MASMKMIIRNMKKYGKNKINKIKIKNMKVCNSMDYRLFKDIKEYKNNNSKNKNKNRMKRILNTYKINQECKKRKRQKKNKNKRINKKQNK